MGMYGVEEDHRLYAGTTKSDPPALTRLDVVSLALAKDWFYCDLPEEAEKEIDAPDGVKQWLRADARSSLYMQTYHTVTA